MKIGGESEANDIDIFLNDIYTLLGIAKINSVETEKGKKQAIEEGNFSKKDIKYFNDVIKKFALKIEKKLPSDTEKIKFYEASFFPRLDKLISELENEPFKKSLVKYIRFEAQEYVEKYEFRLYRGSINNYFEQRHAAHLSILTQEVETGITHALILQGYTRQYVDETYGGIFSKKGLDFLRSRNIITAEEYKKYSAYTPTVESLLTSLKGEGTIDELVKTYFPEQKGQEDGVEQALQDFLQANIEAFDPRDISQILSGITQSLGNVLSGKYGVSGAKKYGGELYELFTGIDDIVAGLEPYKKSYYKSYVSTSLGLVIIPVKIGKAGKALKKEESKSMKEVKEIKKKKDDAKNLTNLSSQMIDPNKINRDNVAKLLQLSESGVGHTIQKHVGKSDKDLKDRVQGNIKQGFDTVPDATTFTDLATAEKTIRDALKTSEGQKLIKNVINASKNKESDFFDPIIIDSKMNIGHGYSDVNGVTKRIEGLTKVNLQLKSDGKGGFIINTVYPVK